MKFLRTATLMITAFGMLVSLGILYINPEIIAVPPMGNDPTGCQPFRRHPIFVEAEWPQPVDSTLSVPVCINGFRDQLLLLLLWIPGVY